MEVDPSTPDSSKPGSADAASGSDPQRRQILDAALEVLRSKGAGALTVRNVAKLAGCSTTGVYTWFGGKPGLVEAIFVEGFESFDAALESAFAAEDPIAPAIAYRTWALANPTQYLVMFGGAVPGFEPSDAAMGTAAGAFERLVVAAEADGFMGDDARREAMWLWATVHGYVMLELAGMSGPALEPPEALYRYGLGRMATSSGPTPTSGSGAVRD